MVKCPACGASDLFRATGRAGEAVLVYEYRSEKGKLVRKATGEALVCCTCTHQFAVKPDGVVPSLARERARAAPQKPSAPAPMGRATMDRDLAALATPLGGEPEDFR